MSAAADEDRVRNMSEEVDEMGEDSFPASDPPAVWTWDIEARAA